MAKQKINPINILNVLEKAKFEMDAGTFNSYLFRANHPSYGFLNPILVEKGTIRKENSKYKWIGFYPDIELAKELLFLHKIRLENNKLRKTKEKNAGDLEVFFEEKTESNINSELTFEANEENVMDWHGAVAKIAEQENHISELEKILTAKQEQLNKRNTALIQQKKYISELDEILQSYKENFEVLQEEFVELKENAMAHKNKKIAEQEKYISDLEKQLSELKNIAKPKTKSNSKKVKILGIPIYSVEY
jgi:uncharacterized coiled-coil protein SlyX